MSACLLWKVVDQVEVHPGRHRVRRGCGGRRLDAQIGARAKRSAAVHARYAVRMTNPLKHTQKHIT